MVVNGLPCYSLNIDDSENTGCFKISLVDFPAVETSFLCFDKDKEPEKFNFKVTDDEKHIVTGIALRCNMPIYRVAPDGTEYYVIFSKETVEHIMQKFAKDNNGFSISLQHELDVNDCYVVESYLINKERGIVPQEFSDIEDGSWVVSVKIENPKVWEYIKQGNCSGFSIEILAVPEVLKAAIKKDKEDYDKDIDKLKSVFDDFFKVFK